MPGNTTILLTGAMGNLGRPLVAMLIKHGFNVRALEIPTRRNRNRAKLFPDAEFIWGDIRDRELIATAVQGCHAVIHLAFLLPPLADEPWAFDVNVTASRNLVDLFETEDPNGHVIFASSYAVHGDTEQWANPVTPESPVDRSNNYNSHKLEVEKHIRESGITWSIMRLGVVMSEEMVLAGSPNPLLFHLAPTAHQEFIHAHDAARAMVHLLERNNAWKKILMIGGGTNCQLEYLDLINRNMKAIGLGHLPERAFSPVTLQGGGWMDTTESQELLEYQEISFDQFIGSLQHRARFIRPFIKLAGPVARWFLLRQSPWY